MVMSAVPTRFMLRDLLGRNSADPNFTLERGRHANKLRARSGHRLTDCTKYEISKISEWSKTATLRQNCNTGLCVHLMHNRSPPAATPDRCECACRQYPASPRVWSLSQAQPIVDNMTADILMPNEPLNSN